MTTFKQFLTERNRGTVLFQGLHFRCTKPKDPRRARGDTYIVVKDDEPIGMFTLDRSTRANLDALNVHTHVVERYLRQGFGKIIYAFAEKLAHDEGKRLLPSPSLSSSSREYWKKYHPEAYHEVFDEDGSRKASSLWR